MRFSTGLIICMQWSGLSSAAENMGTKLIMLPEEGGMLRRGLEVVGVMSNDRADVVGTVDTGDGK